MISCYSCNRKWIELENQILLDSGWGRNCLQSCPGGSQLHHHHHSPLKVKRTWIPPTGSELRQQEGLRRSFWPLVSNILGRTNFKWCPVLIRADDWSNCIEVYEVFKSAMVRKHRVTSGGGSRLGFGLRLWGPSEMESEEDTVAEGSPGTEAPWRERCFFTLQKEPPGPGGITDTQQSISWSSELLADYKTKPCGFVRKG